MDLFTKTLGNLTLASQLLKQQADAVSAIRETLEAINLASGNLPTDTSFEVHLQAYDPSHTAIKTGGPSLGAAYLEAVRFWDTLNEASNETRCPRAEVFFRKGDHLVALFAEDAVEIANREFAHGVFNVDQFTIDSRMTGSIDSFVWKAKEELPGWHSKFMTRMPQRD